MRGHLSYKNRGTHLVGGGEASFDHASLIIDPSSSNRSEFRRFSSDKPEEDIDIRSHAFFGTAKHRFDLTAAHLTFSVGARLDESQLFGGQVSPRMGVVYDSKDITAKLLYNSGFRAPMVGNSANSAYGIDPEKPWRKRVFPETSAVYEAEIGYRLWEGATLTSNVFYQEMSDVIEFKFDPVRQDVYSANGGRIGTYGLEGELRVRGRSYRSVSSISYFTPKFTSMDGSASKGGETYIDPRQSDSLLGVPYWKFSSHHSYSLSERLSAQFLLLWLSRKRAIEGWESSKSISPELILTTGIIVDRFFDVPGLSLNLSLNDLLSEGPSLATPFRASGWDVIQYRGRELVAGLEYKF